jgi:NAD(P)H-hydrate epimerase
VIFFDCGECANGNRFVSPDIQKKYDLELPEYEGIDQIVEVSSSGEKL